MSDKDSWVFIDANAPDGLFICDVCNTGIAENIIAEQDCYRTEWGLYCADCAKRYRNPDGKISGYDVLNSFKKGEEIKF